LLLPEITEHPPVGVTMLAAFPAVPKPAVPSPIAVRYLSDRWVLAKAVAGAADVLVTGDEDLLAIRGEAPIPILDPRAFWDLLRAGPTG